MLAKGINKYLTNDKLELIRNTSIGIIGLGGLGSNCAMNLVRTGFKNFVLMDFDSVDSSNLNRQFYFANQVGLLKSEALAINLRTINSNLNLDLCNENITSKDALSKFDKCHIIIEAVDSAVMKKYIVEKFIVSSKIIITASGMGGWGKAHQMTVRKLSAKLYVVGDLGTEVNEYNPPLSPGINVAAALQADTVLKLILGEG